MAARRRSPEERARLAAEFRASGLKQKEFAEREGITISALQNWLYSSKVKREPRRASTGFVRVVEARPSPSGAVVVQVGGAVGVTFACAPDANYLASLVRALAC